MEFIKIAYCITIPLLLGCSLFCSNTGKKYAINLLAVSNILLIGNSVFVMQQLWALYRLSSFLPSPNLTAFQPDVLSFVHLLLMLAMPFFSLFGYLRKKRLFSLILWIVLYTFYPVSTWNFYGIDTKIILYLCLLCAGYALLWLLNRLPYQSSPN